MLLRRAQVHGLAELTTVAEGSPRPAQPPWWGPSLPFAFHSDFSYVAGPVAAFYVTGIRRAMSVFMRHGRKGRQHAQKRDGTNKVVVAAYTEHAARTRSHRRRSPSTVQPSTGSGHRGSGSGPSLTTVPATLETYAHGGNNFTEPTAAIHTCSQCSHTHLLQHQLKSTPRGPSPPLAPLFPLHLPCCCTGGRAWSEPG